VSKRKGRVNLTVVEKREREDFVIKRLKAGMSRREVALQFMDRFKVNEVWTFICIQKALDSLIIEDNSEERKRNRAAILEMYHDQLINSQSDLMALQQELDKIDRIISTRASLQEASLEGDRMASFKLELLPEIPPTAKANLLAIKSKMRGEMFKIMIEIGKIQGCYTPETPWVQAVNTLLDQDLISSEVAQGILEQIEIIKSPRTVDIKSVKSD